MIDNQGIGIGDVETRFDDGGTEQQVAFAVHEAKHHLLQFMLSHLSMPHSYFGLRHQLRQQFRSFGNSLDPVMDEENLSTATQFAQHRFTDQLFGEAGHDRFDRQAIHRRRINDREVTNAHHRHIQRSRDRSRREGHDINHRPERFETLLVLDTKALFLVDDQKAQILKSDIFLQKTVGTDNDIDIAFFEPFKGFFLLFGGAETGQHLDRNRIIFQPLAESFVMLLGQDGGGHEDADLLAVQRRLERPPQCNLGFTIADISADQSIHRL